MINEVAALRGRLAVSQKLVETLSAGIDSDIAVLRALADKYEEKTSLNTTHIVLVAARIDNDVKVLREVTAKIGLLKKDLGET
jgi:hypothetical protein